MKYIIIMVIISSLVGLISSGLVSTNVLHVEADDHWNHGFWQKKMSWKARWVKTWQPKQIYVAVWKRVWGPVETKEWVALPKPPPGWIPH